MNAIDRAQAGGARLAQACQIIGISARTIERWRDHPQGEDARHGPHHRPHNALSLAEEAQVLSVLTSFRYAELSPKQLVPQLADEGLYLASGIDLLPFAAAARVAQNAAADEPNARDPVEHGPSRIGAE